MKIEPTDWIDRYPDDTPDRLNALFEHAPASGRWHLLLDMGFAPALRDRMPAVDRNVLRLGVWELLHSDTPEPVVLSEAVALVQQLSTDESPVFVNGVLGAIARDRASLA